MGFDAAGLMRTNVGNQPHRYGVGCIDLLAVENLGGCRNIKLTVTKANVFVAVNGEIGFLIIELIAVNLIWRPVFVNEACLTTTKFAV